MESSGGARRGDQEGSGIEIQKCAMDTRCVVWLQVTNRKIQEGYKLGVDAGEGVYE
jgi:hypothetical protein